MTIWRDDVRQALEEIGGSGTLAEIYEAISHIRTELPESWQAIVRRELEHNSSDLESYKETHDLFFSVEGIGAGVWGLRDKLSNSPEAVDIQHPPSRVESTTYRILRDTALSRKIKVLHKHRCQICGNTIELTDGTTYSEAHHIVPLGGGHNGLDVSENILVLCPNHHVACDYGAIKLNKPRLRKAVGHFVSSEFVDYHNSEIYKK